MLSLIVYCKSHKRKPVQFGRLPYFRDAQADIPAGWCEGCGCEIFDYGQTQCSRCHDEKGDA